MLDTRETHKAYQFPTYLVLYLLALIGVAAPGFSQDVTSQGVKSQDIKATILKHLKTSQDFTLKVAAAMPDGDYGFKLSAPQMSFGGQMVHLAQGFDYFLSPIYGEKPKPPKPASETKADVLAFVKESFDRASERIGPLTAEQLEKSYKTDEGSASGLYMRQASSAVKLRIGASHFRIALHNRSIVVSAALRVSEDGGSQYSVSLRMSK